MVAVMQDLLDLGGLMEKERLGRCVGAEFEGFQQWCIGI
jgi:hypothetical protein